VPHPSGLRVRVFSSMRNPLRRFYGRGDPHFVTFSCYRRLPLLGTVSARNRFVRILKEVRLRHAFKLLGYVVMPEHVHLLVSEPEKGTPSTVLQVLKQKVSRALRGRGKKAVPGQLSLPFSTVGKNATAFWQRRFYDFNVWSSEKLREKLEYMHANPVKRKLVVHPKEWPWSSWSHYARRQEGLIGIDAAEEAKDEKRHAARKTNQKPHP